MKKKIIFLTCTWNRVEVTKIFVNSLLETQKKLEDVFECINVVIDSNNSNIEIFKDNPNFIYRNYDNFPVSNKWNYGSSLCKDIDFDYIIMFGSDDIMDDSLLREYYKYMMDGYDYIGILDIFIYDILKENLYYWKGYGLNSGRYGETLGLGRCLSKNVVEQLDYKLWINGINKGLDGSMQNKINGLRDIKIINFYSKDIGFACDIKSDVNITKLNTFINLLEITQTPQNIVLPKLPSHMTIIVPTFNIPEYLEECLTSIINSIQGLYCEILVGIDNCENTVEYIKNKKFDNRIKFYNFTKNVGPYIIKNTLSLISRSDYILFFDSDDILTPKLIGEILFNKEEYNVIKPMYVNFIGKIESMVDPNDREKNYGEGVFAINKGLFHSMNGFEGWRCAADTDFMGRLYKNKQNILHTNDICFYRRVHPSSLTQSKETSYSSKLRSEYATIINNKKDFGPLKTMVISDYNIVDDINYFQSESISYYTTLEDFIPIRKMSNSQKLGLLKKIPYIKSKNQNGGEIKSDIINITKTITETNSRLFNKKRR